jgi:hypothetical protein
MQNITIPKRVSRGLLLLAAIATTAGSLLMGATAANAATLQRVTLTDPDRVVVLGNENNSDVSGQVRFTVKPNGDWKIFSDTRNGRPFVRYVHWTCNLQVGAATVRAETDVVKIRRKSNHTFNQSGNEGTLAALYDTIASSGTATCDIHFGR